MRKPKQFNYILNETELAKTIKERRKDLAITEKQLAEFTDLSHNGISRIELGASDTKLSTLLRMSKILGFKIVLEFEE